MSLDNKTKNDLKELERILVSVDSAQFKEYIDSQLEKADEKCVLKVLLDYFHRIGSDDKEYGLIALAKSFKDIQSKNISNQEVSKRLSGDMGTIASLEAEIKKLNDELEKATKENEVFKRRHEEIESLKKQIEAKSDEEPISKGEFDRQVLELQKQIEQISKDSDWKRGGSYEAFLKKMEEGFDFKEKCNDFEFFMRIKEYSAMALTLIDPSKDSNESDTDVSKCIHEFLLLKWAEKRLDKNRIPSIVELEYATFIQEMNRITEQGKALMKKMFPEVCSLSDVLD